MRSTPDITPHLGSLLKFRHDLHAHPELRYEELPGALTSVWAALGLEAAGGGEVPLVPTESAGAEIRQPFRPRPAPHGTEGWDTAARQLLNDLGYA